MRMAKPLICRPSRPPAKTAIFAGVGKHGTSPDDRALVDAAEYRPQFVECDVEWRIAVLCHDRFAIKPLVWT